MGDNIKIPYEFLDHNIVRDTLIKQGAKVGNRFFDWFDYRCNRLNIHSKHKPIISNKVLMKLEYWKSDGFRGDDGNCGYSIPSTDNLMEVPSFYGENVGMNGWEYINPVTYKDNCLRIGDFRGYTVHEYPLTQSFYCPEKASREIGKMVTCFCMSNTESEESLSIRDIEAIKDCYFGVYAVNVSDNSRTKVAFSGEMGSTSVGLETGGMAIGEWMVYPFFATHNESGHADTKYYPVMNVAPRKMEVVSSVDVLEFQIRGYIDQEARTCSYQILAKNTGSDTTISNNRVYLKYRRNDLASPTEPGESSQPILELFIQTSDNFQTVYGGVFAGLSDEMLKDGRLWFTLKSGQYTGYVDPMKAPTGQISLMMSNINI